MMSFKSAIGESLMILCMMQDKITFFTLSLPAYVSLWKRTSGVDTSFCTDTDSTSIGYWLQSFSLGKIWRDIVDSTMKHLLELHLQGILGNWHKCGELSKSASYPTCYKYAKWIRHSNKVHLHQKDIRCLNFSSCIFWNKCNQNPSQTVFSTVKLAIYLLILWHPQGFGDFRKKHLNAHGFAQEFIRSGMLYRPGKSLKRHGKSSRLHLKKKFFAWGMWFFCEWRHKWRTFRPPWPTLPGPRRQPLDGSISLKF